MYTQDILSLLFTSMAALAESIMSLILAQYQDGHLVRISSIIIIIIYFVGIYHLGTDFLISDIIVCVSASIDTISFLEESEF